MCRNVQGWGEDDANISDGHLVDVRVIDDPQEVAGERLEQRKVLWWEAMHELIESGNLLVLVFHLGDLDEVIPSVRGQDVVWQLTEVQFEQSGNRMYVVIFIVTKEVNIGLCRFD